MTVVFTLPTFEELRSGTRLFGIGSPVGDDSARRIIAQVHHQLQTSVVGFHEAAVYDQWAEQVSTVIKTTDTADPLGMELHGVFLLGQIAFHQRQFDKASAHASWCLEAAEDHSLFQVKADVADFLVAIELAHWAGLGEDKPRLDEVIAFATAILTEIAGNADTFDLEWRLLQITTMEQNQDSWTQLVEQAQHAPTEAQRAKVLAEVLVPLSATAKTAHVIDVCNATIAAARHSLESQQQVSDTGAQIAAARLVETCELVAEIAAAKGKTLGDQHYNRLLNILQLQLEVTLQHFATVPEEKLRALAHFHAQKAHLSITTGRIKTGQKNLSRAVNLYRSTADDIAAAKVYLKAAEYAKEQGEIQLTAEYARQVLDTVGRSEDTTQLANELLLWATQAGGKRKKPMSSE